ncbi:hypothetical protein B0H67DRAFT_203243 [Lasiosphaeris hirsuta]|uniref:Uncharacterized protein n=1 Tax=Lasiosphaeris hirsuta TaxID=260670 RepID=A0AA40DY61_9PEZI|nr:hypothetical protein B0H67DRAFT_203243 [Lasiosphaeris hirsuta]
MLPSCWLSCVDSSSSEAKPLSFDLSGRSRHAEAGGHVRKRLNMAAGRSNKESKKGLPEVPPARASSASTHSLTWPFTHSPKFWGIRKHYVCVASSQPPGGISAHQTVKRWRGDTVQFRWHSGCGSGWDVDLTQGSPLVLLTPHSSRGSRVQAPSSLYPRRPLWLGLENNGGALQLGVASVPVLRVGGITRAMCEFAGLPLDLGSPPPQTLLELP